MCIFSSYLFLRLLDISNRKVEYYSESLNILACAAVVLFPRLIVLVISKSRVILGLRKSTDSAADSGVMLRL